MNIITHYTCKFEFIVITRSPVNIWTGCNWGCAINLANVKRIFKRPYCDGVTYANQISLVDLWQV